jgi:predicted metal-dependent phosphoesterase TrpH
VFRQQLGADATRRSADCMTSPESLVRHAIRRGVDVLAVTDHDTWQGAVDALGVVSRTGAKLTGP